MRIETAHRAEREKNRDLTSVDLLRVAVGLAVGGSRKARSSSCSRRVRPLKDKSKSTPRSCPNPSDPLEGAPCPADDRCWEVSTFPMRS